MGRAQYAAKVLAAEGGRAQARTDLGVTLLIQKQSTRKHEGEKKGGRKGCDTGAGVGGEGRDKHEMNREKRKVKSENLKPSIAYRVALLSCFSNGSKMKKMGALAGRIERVSALNIFSFPF